MHEYTHSSAVEGVTLEIIGDWGFHQHYRSDVVAVSIYNERKWAESANM